MPALPWTQRQAVDPGRTYLAMASRLPLSGLARKFVGGRVQAVGSLR